MTLFSPRLRVERIRIIRGTRTIFEQEFTDGINVLYGENASGKSTVLEAIYFVLGGEDPQWADEMNLCDYVLAQVRANDSVITLRREIAVQPKRPVDVFWGTLDEGSRSGVQAWQRFGYQRAPDRQSFSQLMFEILGMPEVPASDGSNVTMHQIMRFVCQNQMSPSDSIFRADEFDRALTKETVGEFLAGVYAPLLYTDQLELRNREAELTGVSAQMRTLFRLLGPIGQELSIAAAQAELAAVSASLASVRDEISNLRRIDDVQVQAPDQKKVQRLLKDLREVGAELARLEGASQSIEYEIEETNKFLSDLARHAQHMAESDIVLQDLDAVHFTVCPSCFSAVSRGDGLRCDLCKTPYDEGRASPHRARLQRELRMQLEESERLNSVRREELAALGERLRAAGSLRDQFLAEHNELQTEPKTKYEESLRSLAQQEGYLKARAEQINRDLVLAGKVAELSAEKAEIQQRITFLQNRIEAARSSQEKQRAKAFTLISKETVWFLHQDLEREEDFTGARSVSFDFGREAIAVDGHTRFAASSTVFLKNSFLAGFLFASTRDPAFRFPRLLMLDDIEDKGMEEGRVHRLQEAILERSLNETTEHQIFMTAEKLSPKLQSPEYVRGPRYTHDHKTLRFEE